MCGRPEVHASVEVQGANRTLQVFLLAQAVRSITRACFAVLQAQVCHLHTSQAFCAVITHHMHFAHGGQL